MKKKLWFLGTVLLGLVGVFVLILTLGGNISFPVQAQGSDGHSVYYVAPGGSCGGALPCYATVQEAVDAADDPDDVIKVASGTYIDVHVRPRFDITITGVVTQVVYISKTVTIHGGYTTTNWATSDPDTNPTTLDAQSRGRVLYITGNISPTIEGLCITNGNAGGLGGEWEDDAGGGVYVIGAQAIIRDNQIFSNTANDGGGLSLHYSGATLSGNTIVSNTANKGGGLFLGDSDATTSGNTIISNTANEGGGLFLANSDATISGNTIIANTANYHGGGLGLEYSDATLSGNTVISNAAPAGGGLSLWDSDATLSGNTIVSNTAIWEGGGLLLTDSDATLSNNTVSNNIANARGGGLSLFNSNATLTNNSVTDNQAKATGGGLYIKFSSPRLLHVTVARNTAGDGSGVYVTDIKFVGYSNVAMTNTILVSHTVGITVTTGNTVSLESTLWHANDANWGGTGVVTSNNDYVGDPAFDIDGYHLTAGSAAIDKGVDGATEDIDSEFRPYGMGYDLGADEFYPSIEFKKVYLPLVLRQYP